MYIISEAWAAQSVAGMLMRLRRVDAKTLIDTGLLIGECFQTVCER
jgi:hypothetical protein